MHRLFTKKIPNLIYDVGMHKGEDTDYYLKKGFKVIGFEADPDLVQYCHKKFRREIDDGTLIIVEGAIVDNNSVNNDEKAKFFRNKDKSVWGTVDSGWAKRNELKGTRNELLEIAAVDFRRCLIEYGIPHYLKIDIEGNDIICINALNGFNQKPDFLSMESEKLSFDKLKEEIRVLNSLGYVKFQTVNQAAVPNHKEPQDSSEGNYVGQKFQLDSSGLFGYDLPDKWVPKKRILSKYARIFCGYRFFGDKGWMRGGPFRMFLGIINRLSGEPFPGWYDTHAMHSSVININRK